MSFYKVLHQDHIVKHFKSAISSNHLSHAYLFAGQKGVGKTLFAKELSKTLFCENGNGDCCDICNNCLRVDNDNYPDIHWTTLEAKDKFIKIEKIRNLKHVVSLSPVESTYKIFIIKDADRMNEESSNCLLKTLEEPTQNTIIILIANSLITIKDTIKSRCQTIRFHPIPADAIQKQLTNDNMDADKNEIKWVSRFCNGSLGSAIGLLEKNFYAINNDIVNRLSGLSLGQNLTFAKELSEKYLSADISLEEKRQVLRSIFNCMLQYYRDILIVKINTKQGINYDNLHLFNSGCEGIIKTYSNNFTREQIMNIIEEISTSIKYLDYNLNINLLVENLITGIAIIKSHNLIV